MKYSYFPGCTLRTKARDKDAYARVSARALGFELEEIDNWQCCGGVYPLGSDEIATKLSSVRALNEAKEKGQDLVTLCSACHHVIKRVNDDMKNVEDIRTRANNYMKLAEPYEGETEVLHFLEVLRDRIGFDELKKKVVNPLTGKKIGAYYGCLLLRPGKIMAFDNPENPTIIEDFIRAIGAEPVEHGEQQCHTSSCVIVTGAVMAVSWMTSTHDHAVRTFFEGTKDEHRVDTAGTWNTDDLYICRVTKTAASSQVGSCITAPVTAERYNFRSEFFFCFYRHIASTSAIICLFENPCKSIAPDGHATVQAPHP